MKDDNASERAAVLVQQAVANGGNAIAPADDPRRVLRQPPSRR